VFLRRKTSREVQKSWWNLRKGIFVLILLNEKGNNDVVVHLGWTKEYNILMDESLGGRPEKIA
jgi:hypothetical protein